ncbi:uncharacterized protein LOC122643844 [Telopea speciosissima]|uniref:uncharacterized protein LOC122643844 n=1 Tax=Telopea speciosissima TaxID=54955 RepID=UPI001CC80A73|nr:uncharacterized protein LOC122643844 [Telopea speciosissima]
MEDQYIWSVTSKGHFSVASTYSISLKGLLHQSQSKWLKIWHLPTIPKIQHLLWKTIHNKLPLPDLLLNRGLNISSRCNLCDEPRQSTEHLFMKCPLIVPIWNQVGITHLLGNNNFITVLESIITSLNTANRDSILYTALVYSILWYVWVGYWDHTFRHEPFIANRILLRAITVAKETLQHFKVRIHHPTRFISWSRPSSPFLKFNIDSASRGNPGEAGIGGVCCDSQARFICAFFEGVGWNSALVAEALAARRALSIARNLNLRHVIIESDNLLLINLLNGQIAEAPWRIAAIVSDCRSISF